MPQTDPAGEIAATYQRAGFGAAVRRGRRPALIVVDLTRGFTEPGFPTGAELTAEVTAAAELVDAAHAAGAPVVFTAISYTEAELASGVAWLDKATGMRALCEGDPAADLDPRLPYQPGRDHLIVKKGASAYAGTGLAALLSDLGCDTAIVCGATTSGCVRATAVDAVQSGLSVLVAGAAVGDRARPPHDAALFDLDAKYADVAGQRELMDYLAWTRAERRVLGQRALADLADVPARSRWVRTEDGLRLHLLEYETPASASGGADRRLPALILPGITSPAVTFDFVARELTDLVRPIVLDVRGRGLSDSGASYSLEDYARDTEAVIRRLGLERPLLIGHSMGARIAAATAARGQVRVAGSVLVDPPMSGPGRAPYPTTLAAFLGQLDQAWRGTDADEVARSWPRWPRREQELRARWLASCDREAVAATHRGFESESFFDVWPHVPGPCVLLRGAESPVVTEADAAEAARGNAEAEIDCVPGAGHMVFWDNPAGGLARLRAALHSVGKLAHG